MRTRKLVAAAILTAAIAVGVTTPAQANSTDGTCHVGVVLPSKLAITSYVTDYGARLTGDLTCFSFVTWDVSEGLISTGSTLSFFRPNTSGFVGYIGRPAKVHALPSQGAYSVVQYTDVATGAQSSYTVVETGSNTMVAKYDSRIAWRKAHRAGKLVHLSATTASVNDATRIFGTYAAWEKTKVRFQIQHNGRWKTVAVANTDSAGVAHATIKFEKGSWRAVSADSTTTWGKSTGVHKL